MRDEQVQELATTLGRDPALAHTDDEALERAVRTGAAEIAAATCRWLELLAEFVVRGTWAEQGARSPAAWLSWALGLAPSTAREHVRVGLRLREVPVVRARFRAGTLSYSKVRAITRVATPDTEAMLLAWADDAPAHVLERVVRDAAALVRGPSPARDDGHGLRRRWRDDGTLELTVRLDAVDGLAVEQALERLCEVAEPDAPDPDPGELTAPGADHADGCDHRAVEGAARPSRAVREADALVGALQLAVGAAPQDTSGEDRHVVVARVEAVALADALTDHRSPDRRDADRPVDPAPGASAEAPDRDVVLVRDAGLRPRGMDRRLLRRLACAGSLRLEVDRDGLPVGHGRLRRRPDARLRRLLQARDGGCAFPGCGATRFLHAHHVRAWGDGGPTELDNLVLLCGHHHRLVHDAGWRLVAVDATRGRWSFHPPEGTPGLDPDVALPRARPLPGASAEALRSAAAAHGLHPSPDDLAPPTHDGTPHDHALAVAVLAEHLAGGVPAAA